MRRILLVIDDFNELVGLETLFRRLGFDVLSLGRESLVVDAILGFPPDLVIATGRGRHINGIQLASKLRIGSVNPRLVVLLPSRADGDFSADPDLAHADVDAVIETPFDPQAALKVVARLLAIPSEPLLEKFEKIINARLFEPEELKIIKHQEAPERLIHVTGTGEASPKSSSDLGSHGEAFGKPKSEREKRYEKFLAEEMEAELPPMLNADLMREAKLRLEESEKNRSIEEEQRIAKLQREKREFVRAMIETAESLNPTDVIRRLSAEEGGGPKRPNDDSNNDSGSDS